MRRWILLVPLLPCIIGLFYLKGYAADFTFVTLQFPPLEYENDDQGAEGAIVDVVRTIMDRLGYTVNIQVLPWTRALQKVRTGKADAIFTAYRIVERESYLDYSNEILISQEMYFFKKKGSAIQFDGRIDSIKDARIGIVSTISYGQVFDAFRPLVELDKANQLSHNFEKLVRGRIDLLPSNLFVAEYTIRKMRIEDQVERLPKMVESIPSYIAFSRQKDLHRLRQQFDDELRKLKRTGEYSELMRQHGVKQ